jgi:hypothetical protein
MIRMLIVGHCYGIRFERRQLACFDPWWPSLKLRVAYFETGLIVIFQVTFF